MKFPLQVIMKMPLIIGILIFIGRENFKLVRVEHEKSSITSGLDKKNLKKKSTKICCGNFLGAL